MKKSSTSHQPQRKKNQRAAHQSKPSAAGSVRIIGGQFKRRNVTFIDANGLRPTPDRLRETLFNWLLADIHGARVLDCCAGSGVLGFEALSRGAAHCTFIEANHAQSKMLEQSAQQLKINADSYQILYGAAEQVLNQNQAVKQMLNLPFNIVFIDPPYAHDLWQPILTALISNEFITIDTLIYLEADKDLTTQLETLTLSLSPALDVKGLNGFKCLKQVKVGQVVAGLYQLSLS